MPFNRPALRNNPFRIDEELERRRDDALRRSEEAIKRGEEERRLAIEIMGRLKQDSPKITADDVLKFGAALGLSPPVLPGADAGAGMEPFRPGDATMPSGDPMGKLARLTRPDRPSKTPWDSMPQPDVPPPELIDPPFQWPPEPPPAIPPGKGIEPFRFEEFIPEPIDPKNPPRIQQPPKRTPAIPDGSMQGERDGESELRKMLRALVMDYYPKNEGDR